MIEDGDKPIYFGPRLPAHLQQCVDSLGPPGVLPGKSRWRRKQDDLPGRPEAIRRLVDLGLKAKS
jgi:hypothetical protein